MDSIRPAALADAGALTVIAQAAKRHWGYPEPLAGGLGGGAAGDRRVGCSFVIDSLGS